MASPNPPSPLLALPAEIRAKIYSHLLLRTGRSTDYQGWLHIHATGRSWNRSTTNTAPIYPSILCTNSQIYHEARAILYGENRFLFSGTKEVWAASFKEDFSQAKEMERFFEIVGFENAALIREMRVDTAWTMEAEGRFRFGFVWGGEGGGRLRVRSGKIRSLGWKDAGWKKQWSIECVIEVVDGEDSNKESSSKVEGAIPA